MADPHPADDMYSSIKGLFNGDNLKQAVRDAWDRLHVVDADAAARIRAKAGK